MRPKRKPATTDPPPQQVTDPQETDVLVARAHSQIDEVQKMAAELRRLLAEEADDDPR